MRDVALASGVVAPPGVPRRLRYLIATCVAGIRLECHDSVEDIVPGSARLGLLAFDPSESSREALSAKIEALRARCDGAPIGLVIPTIALSAPPGSARLASPASYRFRVAWKLQLRRCV